MKWRGVGLVVACGVVGIGVLYAIWGMTQSEPVVIEGPPRGLSNRSAVADGVRPPRPFEPISLMSELPAVEGVATERPSEAGAAIGDDETVIGVVVGGEARAYPTAMMAEPQQEVLNDVLDGRPLAVTWCSKCRYAKVFDRRVEGQTLTFLVAGMLWEGTMVMADQETKTLWSQILGSAETGKLLGRELQEVPSVVTEWKAWKAEHPETTVAVLPRLMEPVPHRQEYGPDAKDPFVLGYATRERSRTWPLAQLRSNTPVNDEFQGRAMVAVYDKSSETAGLFDREIDGKILEFRSEGGRMVDTTTSSEWNPATGRALSGTMMGKALSRIPATVIPEEVWEIFHPEATVWSSSRG